MAEAQRKIVQQESDLGLNGFEGIFGEEEKESNLPANTAVKDSVVSESYINAHVEKLTSKVTELVTLSVDQRVEIARLSNQLIENQRQLVATQQILIRLMERNIDLTRHISCIEEKLPAIFELPSIMEKLKDKVAVLEGVELE